MAHALETIIVYAGSIPLAVLFVLLAPFAVLKISRSVATTGFRRVHFLDIKEVLLLLAWVIIPLIALFVISRYSSLIHARYAIAASLPFYLLAARSIKNITSRYLKITTVILVITLSLINLRSYYFTFNKEQWRDVALHVDKEAKAGEILIFNAGFCQSSFNYYSKRFSVLRLPFPKKGIDIGEKQLEDFKELVQGHKGFWFILSHEGAMVRPIETAFTELFDLVEVKKFVGIRVYHFQRRY